ncbi:hypothetical protein [Cryobacterium zongtaii]|uniref:hypothetical protein n=1 Tax=Cryobacterium zongtaii TaxID=1259217 RepID=UPI0013FD7444|nr:hypothetical protein [Cryobacterium zongtaii]
MLHDLAPATAAILGVGLDIPVLIEDGEHSTELLLGTHAHLWRALAGRVHR